MKVNYLKTIIVLIPQMRIKLQPETLLLLIPREVTRESQFVNMRCMQTKNSQRKLEILPHLLMEDLKKGLNLYIRCTILN
jgi:hypothetical protein